MQIYRKEIVITLAGSSKQNSVSTTLHLVIFVNVSFEDITPPLFGGITRKRKMSLKGSAYRIMSRVKKKNNFSVNMKILHLLNSNKNFGLEL